LRGCTRNAGAFRLVTTGAPPRMAQAGVLRFPALRHHGGPRERFLFWCCGADGRCLGAAVRAGRVQLEPPCIGGCGGRRWPGLPLRR